MFERISPDESKVDVLSGRRSRRQDVFLVIKKGQDLTGFSSALTTVLEEKTVVTIVVSTSSVEILELDETVGVSNVLKAHLEDQRSPYILRYLNRLSFLQHSLHTTFL